MQLLRYWLPLHPPSATSAVARTPQSHLAHAPLSALEHSTQPLPCAAGAAHDAHVPALLQVQSTRYLSALHTRAAASQSRALHSVLEHLVQPVL